VAEVVEVAFNGKVRIPNGTLFRRAASPAWSTMF
jgi:hypothetical protein